MWASEKYKLSPNYPLVRKYYGEAETKDIIESGTPINRPGIVPSIQVPPMDAGCLSGLGDYEPPLWRDTVGQQQLANYGFLQTVMLPLAVSPSGLPGDSNVSANRPLEYGGDPALAWVEDNWLVIASALGGLLLLSVITGKRRR